MRTGVRPVMLVILAPLLAAGHCKEDCGPPALRLVGARQLEHTLYGAGVLVERTRGAPLAKTLAPYERRELKVDVSQPALVVLVTARAARALGRRDRVGGDPQTPASGGRRTLAVGDRGDGFRVVGAVESKGKLPLLDGADGMADADHEGYDAVLLVPRDPATRAWEASVEVDVGRRVERRNDEAGTCVDADRTAAVVPEWTLLPLPPGCGDGVRTPDEDCDDGNLTPGDGCSPYCLKER
jgi:cysteine-rich repeat protein